MTNGAGEFIKNLSGELQYSSFLPNKLPENSQIEYDSEMINLLTEANRSLGELNGISARVPDIDIFVSMYLIKEALLSSQIEGTQATIDDVLNSMNIENANLDVAEVLSYIKASKFALVRLEKLPVCNRLIKETHKILMSNTRGEEKTPGEFRRSQNWIGPVGGTLKEAKYIPPNHMDMIEAMSDLEKFINNEDAFEDLVKIALVHYQFETIHPFLDGNGRIGRLLISLFFMEKRILAHETLYISYFLKKNRIEYFDRLTEVRNKGNYEQWIKFFLRTLHESAQDSIKTIKKLAALHGSNSKKISEVRGREGITLRKVYDYIERSPIINIGTTGKELELSYNAVSNAVETLVNLGILIQTANIKRNRIFAYEEYLEILREGT